MLGYIQALIDCHVRRFEEASKRGNNINAINYEKHFIEELEGLKEFYLMHECESYNDPIVISIDGESLGNIDLGELGW
ncbi:hypothetical protein ACV3R5_15350 [Clostridium perfringens]